MVATPGMFEMKATRKRGLLLSLALAAALGSLPESRAASLTWDIDASTIGAQAGNGTWADGAGSWWDGSANVNWNSATPDDATLAHTPLANSANYTVTLGSNITVGSITKNGGTSGLAIIAPDGGGLYKLTLNGDFTVTRGLQIKAPLVLAGNGVTHAIGGAYPLIINGNITEAGGTNALAVSFGPTLTLTGTNTFSGGLLGGLNTSVGKIELGSDTAAGTGPIRLGQDNQWKAINGNRNLANALLGTAAQYIRKDWYAQFEGYEINFTSATALTLEGHPSYTDARYVMRVNNAKTTINGGVNNGTVATRIVGIVKEGPGVLVINGTSAFEGDDDYTEAVTINQGTLILNGRMYSRDGSGGQKNYLVNSSGTLGGTGTVNLASGRILQVSAGGALAPGNEAVGTLTVNGAVTLAENAGYAWQYLNGTGDLVDVNGTLTLPNAATVTVSGSGSLPATMTLFTADALAGATDLSGWTVSGLSGGTVQIQGTRVTIKGPPSGTVLSVK